MSRIQPQDNLEVLAISAAQPVWLETVVNSYAKFPDTAKLLTALALQSPFGEYTLTDGVIKYKGRVVVPDDQEIQLRILQALHASPVAGHSRFHVTYQRLKHLFC